MQRPDHPLPVLMEDEMIAEVHEAVEQGLITPAEATLIIQGKTL
jgi:hypothetical protein